MHFIETKEVEQNFVVCTYLHILYTYSALFLFTSRIAKSQYTYNLLWKSNRTWRYSTQQRVLWVNFTFARKQFERHVVLANKTIFFLFPFVFSSQEQTFTTILLQVQYSIFIRNIFIWFFNYLFDALGSRYWKKKFCGWDYNKGNTAYFSWICIYFLTRITSEYDGSKICWL